MLEPPDVQVSELGLSTDRRLTRAEWERIGRNLTPVYRRASWVIGDWIAASTMKPTRTLAFASDLTGYTPRTLTDFRWVARSIAPERRRAGLSWGHHKWVASLEPAQQEHWLSRAESEGWPADRMRFRLRVEALTAQHRERVAQATVVPPAQTYALRLTCRVRAHDEGDAWRRVERVKGAVRRTGAEGVHVTAEPIDLDVAA